MTQVRGAGRLGAIALAAAGLSCGGDLPGIITPVNELGDLTTCDLNLDFVIVGAAPGAIPSLDEPIFVRADEAPPTYLDEDSRVIGLEVGGQHYAIPLSVLWSHEIANFTADGTDLAVTYCPLTGSSLVFSRAAVSGEPFGISGLLYQNNLVMSDFEGATSLWPQMIGQARCGTSKGTTLGRWPAVEMEWAHWVSLYPFTQVLADDQGFDTAGEPWRYDQASYPYDDYRTSRDFFTSAMPEVDSRRHPKERVIGLPATATDPGIAFPFEELSDSPDRFRVIDTSYEGEAVIVLWDTAAQGGMAFRPFNTEGESVSLTATDFGFADAATTSHWTVDGAAKSGLRRTEQLQPISEAYTAFWGAWAAFHPETVLWEN